MDGGVFCRSVRFSANSGGLLVLQLSPLNRALEAIRAIAAVPVRPLPGGLPRPGQYLLRLCGFERRPQLTAVIMAAAGIFFLGYVLFEIPSNLMLERVGARRWISRILELGDGGGFDGLHDQCRAVQRLTPAAWSCGGWFLSRHHPLPQPLLPTSDHALWPDSCWPFRWQGCSASDFCGTPSLHGLGVLPAGVGCF